MDLISIYVDGYKNIAKVQIDFKRTITVLIGFNNSGKSNLIESIAFGFDLVCASERRRKTILKSKNKRPLLKKHQNKIYICKIKFNSQGELFTYKIEADWESCEVITERVYDENENTRMDLLDNVKVMMIVAICDSDKKKFSLFSDYDERASIKDVGYIMYHQLVNLKGKNIDRYELLIDSFLNLFPEIDYIRLDSDETIYYKEQHLGRELPLKMLSSGPQKILELFVALACLEMKELSIIFLEEIENSIHPVLIENLLIALDVLASNTKILITSHSPYLIQHINLDSIYLAVPSTDGRASFKTIKKKNELLSLASKYELSTGEFLFNIMLESYYDQGKLLEWL